MNSPGGVPMPTNINSPGVSPVIAATKYSRGQSGIPPQGNIGSTTNPGMPAQSGPSTPQYAGEPLSVWIWFIVLLLGLKYLSEKPESKYNPAYIKIGGYNVLAIGLTATAFILAIKVISIYLPFPGIKSFSAAL